MQLKVARALGALVVTSCVVGTRARAQELEPRNVKPVQVAQPVHTGGHAQTWDGRVIIFAKSYPGGALGWGVTVLRPEGITANAAGVPDFSNAFWPNPNFVLEAPNAPGSGLQGGRGAIAVAPLPGLIANPFRSNTDGSANPVGTHECYELLVYEHDVRNRYGHMGTRRARIVVKEPKTANAAIESASMLTPFQDLRTVSGRSIMGIEPTTTFDGRLLIWQGHPVNNGAIDVLVYSYNPTPGAVSGWSEPRALPDMYHVDRATDVAGVRFDERFPIAKEPLRAADGTLYGPGEYLHGAYPWVTLDGTEVFYTATLAGPERARRGSTSVIGRWSGYQARHIDGPVNPNRVATNRLFYSSMGQRPSMWELYRENRGSVAIPYTAARPVIPLLGASTIDYSEVPFDDTVDGDYVLSLRMNELFPKGGVYLDPTRTPDTSGRSNTGYLQGARFPQEYAGVDQIHGVVGQAIYFGDADQVTVAPSPSLEEARSAISVELFVKRGAGGQPKVLAHRPGAWNLVLEADGRVSANLSTEGGARSSGPVGPALASNEWTHVAFTYDGATGKLRVFVGGEARSDRTLGAGRISASAAPLILGPGGQTPATPGVAAGQAVLMLDEVRVSRVARTDVELARTAFKDRPRPQLAAPVTLARGLDARDLRTPASSAVTRDAALLGQALFSEKGLSKNNAVSCATCHEPQKAFTDGRARARGLNGQDLPRNTPTLVNRALSTRQFFDGRSTTLEEQAIAPIEDPNEMGSTIADVVAFLNASASYRALFQKAFNAGPSRDTIGRALAAFQRTIVSGDSPIDRYLTGDLSAVGDSEKRGHALFIGKARCVACHSGSNFTDEEFHDTAQTDGRDLGRALVTGRIAHRRAFKTPSLRDVARTAPYLHDGSVATLEEVVELYDRGGRTTVRDHEIRPLGLSAAEKADLVAFLKALNGTITSLDPPTAGPPHSPLAPAPPQSVPGAGGPLAPSGLIAAINGGSVTLSWRAIAGVTVTAYVIEAGSAPGSQDLATVVTPDDRTTFTASNLPSGTYHVRVRATNGTLVSAPSNEVAFTIGAAGGGATPPDAPPGLSASVAGTTVTLAWNASSGTPTTYVIEAGSQPGAADLTNAETGSTATSFTTQAPVGTYHVRVRARNAAGTSGASNEVVVTVGAPAAPAPAPAPAPSAPDAPAGLAANVAGGVVTLTWSAPSGQPTSYVIEAGSVSGASNLANADTGSAGTSFAQQVPAGTYYVRVRAKNAVGTSGPSGEVVVVVP